MGVLWVAVVANLQQMPGASHASCRQADPTAVLETILLQKLRSLGTRNSTETIQDEPAAIRRKFADVFGNGPAEVS